MKQRNVGMVIFLSFITLGIYTLYWMYDTRKELMARGAKDIPSVWILIAPVVVTLLLLFMLFILLLGSSSPGQSYSLQWVILGLFYFLSTLVWMGLWIFWIYKYSQAVDMVTRSQTSFMLSFGLGLALFLVGVFFVWPGIIQDGFNKVAEGPDSPPAPTPQHNQTNTAAKLHKAGTPSDLPPQGPSNDV